MHFPLALTPFYLLAQLDDKNIRSRHKNRNWHKLKTVGFFKINKLLRKMAIPPRYAYKAGTCRENIFLQGKEGYKLKRVPP
jgi:hypothetical protein